MSLEVRSFAQITGNIAAAVQGRANALLDYSIGSVLRSIAEAEAGLALWLQGLILQVLSMTRLATSQGDDAFSFGADWGMYPLGAVLSAGEVTFSRFTPTTGVIIPVGTQVRTADGTQSFQVVANLDNSSWSTADNGYLLPASVAQVSVPVQSLLPGVAANVAANTITSIVNSIVGVDYCNNAGAMSGGSDTETPTQFKARFVLYIASLSEGTIGAIKYAVASLKLGMQATILENVNVDGTEHAGFLCITVDDGSGYPPQSTLDAAAIAIGNVRAGGVMWGVFSPNVLAANIAMTIISSPGYPHQIVIGDVAREVTTYVNALPLGQTLAFTHLAAVAYAANPGVQNVTSMSINNQGNDLVATLRNVVKLGSLAVS